MFSTRLWWSRQPYLQLAMVYTWSMTLPATLAVLSNVCRRHVILCAVFAVAVALSVAAAVRPTFPGDLWISQHFQGFESTWLTRYMKAWTMLGEMGPLAVGVACAMALLFLRGYRVDSLFLPMGAAGYLVSLPVKVMVGRPRPSSDLVYVFYHETSKSFPSGHAFAAALILGALFYVADHLFGPRRWVIVSARVLLVCGILSIAASRIYLGEHWMSDVLGGLLLGGLTLFLVVRAFDTSLRWYDARWRRPAILADKPRSR